MCEFLFIQQNIICFYHLISGSEGYRFGQWELLWTVLHVFLYAHDFLSAFLGSGTKRYSELLLDIACLFPGTNERDLFPFSGELHLEMRVKSAPYYWGFAAPRNSQRRDIGNVFMSIFILKAMIHHINTSQVSPSIGFILAFLFPIFATLFFSEKPNSHYPQYAYSLLSLHIYKLIFGPLSDCSLPQPSPCVDPSPTLATTQLIHLPEPTRPQFLGTLPFEGLTPTR